MSLEPEPITVLELAVAERGAGEAPENGEGAGAGDGETDGEEGSTPCGFFPKMVKFPPEKDVEYKRLGAIRSP